MHKQLVRKLLYHPYRRSFFETNESKMMVPVPEYGGMNKAVAVANVLHAAQAAYMIGPELESGRFLQRELTRFAPTIHAQDGDDIMFGAFAHQSVRPDDDMEPNTPMNRNNKEKLERLQAQMMHSHEKQMEVDKQLAQLYSKHPSLKHNTTEVPQVVALLSLKDMHATDIRKKQAEIESISFGGLSFSGVHVEDKALQKAVEASELYINKELNTVKSNTGDYPQISFNVLHRHSPTDDVVMHRDRSWLDALDASSTQNDKLVGILIVPMEKSKSTVFEGLDGQVVVPDLGDIVFFNPRETHSVHPDPSGEFDGRNDKDLYGTRTILIGWVQGSDSHNMDAMAEAIARGLGQAFSAFYTSQFVKGTFSQDMLKKSDRFYVISTQGKAVISSLVAYAAQFVLCKYLQQQLLQLQNSSSPQRWQREINKLNARIETLKCKQMQPSLYLQ